MAGERRPRHLLPLVVLVLALAWPVVVPGAVAQPSKQGPALGPAYVEK